MSVKFRLLSIVSKFSEAAVNIHSVYSVFMNIFRPARMRRLRQLCNEIDGTGRILDVGGTHSWWNMVQPLNREITIVNIDTRLEDNVRAAGYEFAVADGRSLPYETGSFDLVFSNSVIEHVGNWEDQQRFASELLRVGKSVYVQTPNKWFPVEPHLITIFVHWLPTAVQVPLIRWLSVWGWVTKPDRATIETFVSGTRLLSGREFKEIFPGCKIEKEGFLGMAKSYIAVR